MVAYTTVTGPSLAAESVMVDTVLVVPVILSVTEVELTLTRGS